MNNKNEALKEKIVKAIPTPIVIGGTVVATVTCLSIVGQNTDNSKAKEVTRRANVVWAEEMPKIKDKITTKSTGNIESKLEKDFIDLINKSKAFVQRKYLESTNELNLEKIDYSKIELEFDLGGIEVWDESEESYIYRRNYNYVDGYPTLDLIHEALKDDDNKTRISVEKKLSGNIKNINYLYSIDLDQTDEDNLVVKMIKTIGEDKHTISLLYNSKDKALVEISEDEYNKKSLDVQALVSSDKEYFILNTLKFPSYDEIKSGLSKIVYMDSLDINLLKDKAYDAAYKLLKQHQGTKNINLVVTGSIKCESGETENVQVDISIDRLNNNEYYIDARLAPTGLKEGSFIEVDSYSSDKNMIEKSKIRIGSRSNSIKLGGKIVEVKDDTINTTADVYSCNPGISYINSSYIEVKSESRDLKELINTSNEIVNNINSRNYLSDGTNLNIDKNAMIYINTKGDGIDVNTIIHKTLPSSSGEYKNYNTVTMTGVVTGNKRVEHNEQTFNTKTRKIENKTVVYTKNDSFVISEKVVNFKTVAEPEVRCEIVKDRKGNYYYVEQKNSLFSKYNYKKVEDDSLLFKKF